jgi:hypothetical protein
VITGTTGTFTNISGNGVSLTAINASNITSGTIANARTTASDANGASTIVARDANGSFTANIVTANGSAISAINGSNVTTGTVANARTTAASANGASTIVARDASGDFSARTITASLTGTATTATTANALNTANSYTGVAFTSSAAEGYTGSNRTSIGSGQVGYQWRTGGTNIWWSYLPANENTLNWYNSITLQNVMTLTTAGALTAASFTGNGAAISAINASNLSSGTVASARISGSYTGITGVGTLSAGVWQGTSISTTYTDAKVTSVNGSTGAVTVAAGQFFGSAAVKAIAYNSNTIGENVTVTTGNNGLSAGPVTINSGFTVTVQSGAVWVIV